MAQTLRSRTLVILVVPCLMMALAGCTAPSQKAAAAKAGAHACANLGKRLCKGSEDSIAICNNTLDLLTPEVCTSALSTPNINISLAKLTSSRKKCDELITKLCTDLGSEAQGCALAKASINELTRDRCEGMLGEYDQVLTELKRQEEQNQPLPPEAQAKLTAGHAPSFGPEDAKVTIVEFSDFQCPYCSRAAAVTRSIKEKYGDAVHFVFRQYPLSFHENAELAAQAALAADAQGKFWQLHDKMFANQGKLDRSALEGYAQELGIDMKEFRQALDQERYKPMVKAELDLGEEAAVDGTPTMFINGLRLGNPTNFESVSAAIDLALAKAKS